MTQVRPTGSVAGPVWLLAAALTSTALVVVPQSAFAFPNEVFVVPKAFALGVSALGAGVLLARRASQLSVRASLLHLAVAAYFSLGLISWSRSGRDGWALLDWLARDGASALLFFLARTREAGQKTRRIATVIVAVACIQGFVAFLEAMGVPLMWSELRRPVGLLGNRNFLGAYAAVAIPFALTLALARPGWLRLAALTLLFATLVVTRCRSAWVGLLASALVVAAVSVIGKERPSWRASYGRVIVAVAVGVGIAAVVPWPGLRWVENRPLTATAGRMLDYDHGSGKVRITQLRLAMTVAAAHPLGGGPGGWDDAESEYAGTVGEAPRAWQVNPTPSSDLARTLAELGFPGAALVGAIGTWIVVSALRTARRGTRRAPWGMPVAAALVVACVHVVLDAPLFRPPMIPLFVIVAGLASGDAASRAVASLPRQVLIAIPLVTAIAAVVAPICQLVASLETPRGASLQARMAAQEIYPRVYVGEGLARDLGAKGDCSDADEQVEWLLRRAPHHLGPYRTAATCAQKAGDADVAARWLERLGRVDHSAP